jgi:hypothetical protein
MTIPSLSAINRPLNIAVVTTESGPDGHLHVPLL